MESIAITPKTAKHYDMNNLIIQPGNNNIPYLYMLYFVNSTSICLKN